MPVDYSKYHPEWKDRIRPDILRRDNYRCKVCSVGQRKRGYRNSAGTFIECDEFEIAYRERKKLKVITIFLAVAHLDHDIENNEYSNLAAMCQKCHNHHDRSYRIFNRLNNTK